jgi:hypothetical protein
VNHSEKNIKDSEEEVDNIKDNLKKIHWDKISTYWIVTTQPRNLAIKILLDPSLDCSKSNPLYIHKKWLEHLYNIKNFSDRLIAKVCSVDHGTIRYWRQKHNISTRSFNGRWIDKRSRKIMLYMPEEYRHPELTPIDRGKGRNVRPEHIIIMENFLVEHPEIEISKRILNSDGYLDSECDIHHINLDPLDNRLENLWICESRSEHKLIEGMLLKLVKELIQLDIIFFTDGKYHLNY